MTPLTDAELEAMKTTTSPAARIIQESVLGFDSRFQVNPYTYPERAVALITYNGNTHCTGWLISKDTLVTAEALCPRWRHQGQMENPQCF